jgi:hypothetical protein
VCRRACYFVSFLVLSLAVTCVAEATDWGLAGWWRFDEGSGDIAYDSSSYGNHGSQFDGLDTGDPEACTIGVANGFVTIDSRPILWKVRDTDDRHQQLVHSPGYPYNYIGVRSRGGSIYMGLNEAGLCSGNSAVSSPEGSGSTNNASLQNYVLRNCDSVDQVRDYIQSEIDFHNCNASGCFPFIDADRNAVIFEVNRSNWFLEYDSMDPDREAQGLLDFVVRANEFHQRADGTDDISITGGRYESGTYNVLGLVSKGMLCIQTIIQGDAGLYSSFEFVRYGPSRTLSSISRSSNRSTIVVHGVAPGEDPALATMWVILGQSNFGIAVPTWVGVSDIPHCLASGEMYDRAKSLYNKGNEATTQASTFLVEAHMFDIVVNTLLPHWRAEGVPSVAEMSRIEHQMANDAYSLLDCLDNYQSDNKAPEVSISAFPDGLTLHFTLAADDPDGSIAYVLWDFGDSQYSTETSPSHTYVKPGTYLVSCTVVDDDKVGITDWRYYAVPVNCDLAVDGVVDFLDLEILASNWAENNLVLLEEPGREIARWAFDEGRGTIAHDSVGNNDATIEAGTAWVNDRDRGWCLGFDGSNDYASVPSTSNLNPSTMTVSAWIKAETWTPESWRGCIVSKDDWERGRHGYALRCGDNGRLSCVISTGTGWPDAVSNAVMHTGHWYHVAGTYDGGNIKVYINGIESGSASASGPIDGSSYDLNIGRGTYAKDRLFHGMIDDVRLFNYALSPEGIAIVYEDAPLPLMPPQFVCSGYPAGDLNEDCQVDLLDFAILASAWLKSGP